jgi:hypothetical protein
MLFKKSNRPSRDSTDSGTEAKPSNLTLGQSLLESKQNLLAKVNLSPEEDAIRITAEAAAGSFDNEMTLEDMDMEMESTSGHLNMDTEDMGPSISRSFPVKVIDISKEEVLQGPEKPGSLFFRKKHNEQLQSSVRALELSTWRELKALVLGPRGNMHEGWYGQGFSFNHKIPYGLVQKKVSAYVQFCLYAWHA